MMAKIVNDSFLLRAIALICLLTSPPAPVLGHQLLCNPSAAVEEALTADARHLQNDTLDVTDMLQQSTATGGLDVDQSICTNMTTPGAVNLRTTCPWHYEVDLQEGRSPSAITKATLTCGSYCLRVNSRGQKVRSNYPCLAVRRQVAVLRCSFSGGQRCCHVELLSVPVAFTCGFPY